ncbi:T-cell immunoglobulin and mucin domain-containing protein 4-like isoform X3 [Cottoperca gobio]|uniref:T-cell immunoglobulin and mucin domain-containing protein 4-like isoform X3 n=1 Tax=Cottoperca gobio TaxID=56716 RepID=UPI00110F36A0|nr:T-cell immunoglobulin and mucin domain-containing protein 4-like isoform X3 [Cottoperca gobio]
MRGLCYFYLSILTQVSSSTFKVIGLVGHDVTLPCRYDSQTHGSLSFCWGRGMVPRSKCSSTILSSEVGAVQSRRYQLLGNVTDGDVSLTILDAQWSDAGMYGCRLEIPGWFNDKKFNTRLVMEEAPVEEPVTLDWTFTVGGTQEILTEFATSAKNVEVGEPTLDMMRIAATEVRCFFGGGFMEVTSYNILLEKTTHSTKCMQMIILVTIQHPDVTQMKTHSVFVPDVFL